MLLTAMAFCTMPGCTGSIHKGSKAVDSARETVRPDGVSILPKENYIVDTERVDEVFASEASNGEMAEMAMGKLAQSRGYNEKVRLLGKMIGYGDSIANQRLGSLTAERRMLLLADLEKHEQEILNNLKTLTGKGFDKACVNALINAYTKDIGLFERSAPDLNDIEIKQFALQTLPIIKTHLSKCRQVSAEISEAR